MRDLIEALNGDLIRKYEQIRSPYYTTYPTGRAFKWNILKMFQGGFGQLLIDLISNVKNLVILVWSEVQGFACLIRHTYQVCVRPIIDAEASSPVSNPTNSSQLDTLHNLPTF